MSCNTVIVFKVNKVYKALDPRRSWFGTTAGDHPAFKPAFSPLDAAFLIPEALLDGKRTRRNSTFDGS